MRYVGLRKKRSTQPTAAVSKYNEKIKRIYDKMPLVLRNQQTGWPLLQVTFFTAIGDGRYEPVLGGEKCHNFPIAHFCFAMLLAHADGTKSATDYYHNKVTMNQFSLHNIQALLDGFEFKHNHYDLTITTKKGSYGKETTLNAISDDALSKTLYDALYSAFEKSLKAAYKGTISQISGRDDPANPNHEKYSTDTIRSAINPECAIFYNGNIFIDLGLLSQDKAYKEYLETIFKPKVFLALAIPKQTLVVEPVTAPTTMISEVKEAPAFISPSSSPSISSSNSPDIKPGIESFLMIGAGLTHLMQKRPSLNKSNDGTGSTKTKLPGLNVEQIKRINNQIEELGKSVRFNIKALFSDSARQNAIAAFNHIIELDNQNKPVQLRELIEAMKDRKAYTDDDSGHVYKTGWSSTSDTAEKINQLYEELYNPQKTLSSGPEKK